MKHRGNCHCGHVSHETDLDPMVIVQCHCASCRRLTGAVSVTTLYAEEEISVEGDTDIYVFKGGVVVKTLLFITAETITQELNIISMFLME